MRTFRLSLCFTLALATLWVTETSAQQSSSRRSVRQTERVARASWQPTRSHVARRPDESEPTRHPQFQQKRRSEPLPLGNRLRRVDHIQVEGVPMPPPDESISVIDPPMDPTPLDGQISLEPVHVGSVPCDAMPGGMCGCGDAYCGGCDSGCDAMGGCDGRCGSGSCCGELCGPNAWRPCMTLCLPQDGWVSLEYLGWWQDGMDLPPLVTTSTDPNVPRDEAGVLTSPSTRVLYGGDEVLTDAFEGARLRFGVWLDRCHTWGVGAEFFEIGRESDFFRATSSGTPALARPFFNTQSGVEDSELVAYPQVVSGTVGVVASSKFAGGGVYFRRLRKCREGCSKWLFCGCPDHFCSRTEGIIGYRHVDLQESVQITENLISTDSNNPGTFDIVDRFETRNQFNGVDMGLMYRSTRGYWTFDGLIKLAVGNNRQSVTINGQTTINDPSADEPVQTYPGGLLTQTSNIGAYRKNEFSVVPEFNLNLGYQLTDHFRAMVGYTGIYWSNVVRPGQHISRDVNPALLPPPAEVFSGTQRPAFAFDTTDYWVQGINFGGEYRW